MTSASAIRADIIMFFQTLNYVNNGIYSAWDTRTFDLSRHDNMDGTLVVNNAQASLTMKPYEAFTFATVDVVENDNFKACVHNVSFPDFNVTFDYIADFGINDDIPIYGSGSYHGRLNDVATTFCWWLPPDANEILDFDINVKFWHRPSFLTGFYRNKELDPILADLLTLGKRLLAMWNNYEPECSSKCILNPIFLFMTNYLIYDIDKSSEISLEGCACLKELLEKFTSEIDLISFSGLSQIMDHVVENLVDEGLLHHLKEILFS